MAHCDFVVKYNPEVDSQLDIFKRILYSIVIKPLKNNKPRIGFISGDSGEGKSRAALRLMELLCEIQGIDIRTCFDVINIHTPLQYPEKMNKLIFDKNYKRVNMVAIHEAREIIRAKDWNQFVVQAVADVNATSRALKRMSTWIISQFIRDISTDTRYTLNFYIKASRPLGRKTRLYWYVLWKDDSDLEKPKLRKRKLAGYLVLPDGRYKRFIPQYFEVSLPTKDLDDLFEKNDFSAKGKIIKRKFDQMLSELQEKLGEGYDKVDALVQFYSNNPKSIENIGKHFKGQWRLKPTVRNLHDLKPEEARIFEKRLNEQIRVKQMIYSDQSAEEENGGVDNGQSE